MHDIISSSSLIIQTDKGFAHKNDNLKDDVRKDESGVGTTLVTDPPSQSTHDNG